MRLELSEDRRVSQRRTPSFLEPRRECNTLATVASRRTLLTDVANPASDTIYGEIGYHRFAGIDEYRFERSA